MDSAENFSLKKQRNAKIHRDKRKNTHSRTNSGNVSETPIHDSTQNVATVPQPQRANSNQRNNLTSNKNAATDETSKVASQEVTMVDHSNLKRETEEIVKLTKKFSKREVTSNWHRYAVEESDPSVKEVEEEAPADFTDLLQVPVSRGGHLQLKEEQGWSSAVPGAHWALDLKQLSFSLACVPTHERLRLPLEKLSEEDINRYIFLAEEAKKYYYANEGVELKDDVEYQEKPFNILDVENSTSTLINMDLGLEKSLNKLSINTPDSIKKMDLNVSNGVNVSIKEDEILEKSNKHAEIKDSLKVETINASNKANSSDVLLIEADKCDKSLLEVELTGKSEDVSLVMNQQSLSENKPTKNEINEAVNLSTPSVNKLDPEKDNTPKNISVWESNSDQINNYVIKEKRERRRNNKQSPSNQEVDNKPPEKINATKLEDDDDLDFLLSLKQPIPAENKNESKPATLKDSSFLPVTTVNSSTPTTQHTDLDDWLDSVLED